VKSLIIQSIPLLFKNAARKKAGLSSRLLLIHKKDN